MGNHDSKNTRLDPNTPILTPILRGFEPLKVYSPPTSNTTVAVCLIVRNETIYLDEWVDFHLALGFAPIFIYDNSGAPDLELEMWYERRTEIWQHVHIIHFPIAPVQQYAYERCTRIDAPNATFAAMIDVDEFVVLKKHDNIVDFMDDHCNSSDCGQISINWITMGTSNETRYRPIPITKRNVHVHTFKGLFSIVKAIVRPTYIADNMDWSHTVMLKRGHWIDTNGTILPRVHSTTRNSNPYLHTKGPTDVAALYHYRFRSEEEFIHKSCVRGDSLQNRGVNPKCRHMDKPQVYPRDGLNFDDSAWRQLKRMVPKYRVFDEDTLY